MLGQKLGNYEISGKLGEGGMGEVWRARDARLNRSVAIKILPAEVAGDPVRRQRFEQEARSLGALNHPNIVAVYDIGQSDGRAYIVSELVEGESLRTVLERGPVAGRALLDMAAQIAEAIAAAHALGIVHRDLKPENIMISNPKAGTPGRIKVLDFGLAKQDAPQAGEEGATVLLSQPGIVLGTVGYMSPEQVRGESVDARSDIFSFGCVFYEMATARKTFNGNSAADVMSAVLREDPEFPPGVVPPAVEAIIRRCLEKNPALRFQSAADLAFALRALAGPTTTSQPALTAPAAEAAPFTAPPKKRRKPSHYISAVLAGLAIFAGGWSLRERTLATGPLLFQRLTFSDGRITGARFGTDGRSVIYSASWSEGPQRIYAAHPGNPESRDLDLPETRLLAVSSKGDMAFLTGTIFPDGSATLARNAVSGGQTRQLLEHVTAADWSPDGSELAVVRAVGTKERLEYPIGRTVSEDPYGFFQVRISPSGRTVAFTRYDNGSCVAIYLADRNGKVKRLAVVSGQTAGQDSSLGGGLAWSHDGREIWFRSFDANDHDTIYAIGLDGKRRVAARFPGAVAFYDVAADGRILFSMDNGRIGIRGMAPGATEERDLSVLESADLKGISDDGKEILAEALGQSGGPAGSIYLRGTDGSPAVKLGDGVAYVLSPDGRWLSGYTTRQSTQRTFMVMPTGPGETFLLNSPNVSKGSIVVGWLGGEDNYLVLSHAPGKGRQFFAWNKTTDTLKVLTPPFSPDQVPLVAPDRRSFLLPCHKEDWCIYPVEGGDAKQVAGLTPHDLPVGWSADGKSIYVRTHHNDNRMLPIFLVDVTSGKRTPWKEIKPAIPVDQITNADITPDGRAYAYNYTYTRSELYIAEGMR